MTLTGCAPSDVLPAASLGRRSGCCERASAVRLESRTSNVPMKHARPTNSGHGSRFTGCTRRWHWSAERTIAKQSRSRCASVHTPRYALEKRSRIVFYANLVLVSSRRSVILGLRCLHKNLTHLPEPRNGNGQAVYISSFGSYVAARGSELVQNGFKTSDSTEFLACFPLRRYTLFLLKHICAAGRPDNAFLRTLVYSVATPDESPRTV